MYTFIGVRGVHSVEVVDNSSSALRRARARTSPFVFAFDRRCMILPSCNRTDQSSWYPVFVFLGVARSIDVCPGSIRVFAVVLIPFNVLYDPGWKVLAS